MVFIACYIFWLCSKPSPGQYECITKSIHCTTPLFIVYYSKQLDGFELNVVLAVYMGRDSIVGIANRYGLENPAIECRWKREFPHPSRPNMGPTQAPAP
jgi:hypothetical protein